LVAIGDNKGIPFYRETDLSVVLEKRKKPDDALFSDEVAVRVGMEIRKFRYWAKKEGLVAGGSYGCRDWYKLSDVVEFEKKLVEIGELEKMSGIGV